MVIVDADVMIEVLRKNPAAISFLKNEVGSFNILLSAVTEAEIQQGATNKENLQQLIKFLKQSCCQLNIKSQTYLVTW